MKIAVLLSRLFLGLIFFVFGLNGFFQFLPLPPPTSEAALAFMGGLAKSGYFFPFLKGLEVLCGALLLSGFFVPLATAVLAPIVVNILLYHRLAAGGPPMDILLLAALVVVAVGYRSAFSALFAPKTQVPA